MFTLYPYNGRKIKASGDVETNAVHVLRILAGRERDHAKVNIRTFHANEIKRAGLALTVQDLQRVFEAFDLAGICKLRKGSMNRLEVAEFKESARMAARKILGVQKVLATDQFVLSATPKAAADKDLEAAREVLRTDMPDASKVKILTTLLLKE